MRKESNDDSKKPALTSTRQMQDRLASTGVSQGSKAAFPRTLLCEEAEWQIRTVTLRWQTYFNWFVDSTKFLSTVYKTLNSDRVSCKDFKSSLTSGSECYDSN